VFDVPCPECGAAVEFFKDETSGRCTNCGHRFRNPGIDFGCATWCSLAEQCLGYVPDGDSAPQSTEGALAGRLIQRIGEEFKHEPARMISALKAFHHAKELVAKEGGVPRIALAASLLLEIVASPEGDASGAEKDYGQKVRQMLQDAGAEEETMQGVSEIVGCCRSGRQMEGIEFNIVCDADRLARLTTEYSPDQRQEVEAIIQNQLVTDTARQRARSWCRAVDEGPHE
jgi:hypothetical protein